LILRKENLIKRQKDNLSEKTKIEGFSMAKWKLFNRSKGKEEVPTEVETTIEHIAASEEKPKIPETREESEELSIKEYNETLYSKGSVQKQPATTLPEKKHPLKRTSWESLGTIEHNVDDMGHKQTEPLGTRTQTNNDTDNKVDRILSKKKVRR
jgi:hypothetical protein